MNAEKLKKLKNFELSIGNHPDLEHGACVMEMVSYLADEPWSDHPKCACPILTEYAIRMNDKFNDKDRQRMKEFIPILIGTRSTPEVQIARKRLIRWRNVTVTYPLILESLKLIELAAELRTFKNTLESMAEAKKWLESKHSEVRGVWRAYAYPDTDANADAYAYADADAYAYAYPDTDANADAWRAKIADVALETLRMAIEIKAQEQ